MEHGYGFDDEMRVKERGKQRYFWRAGVMSRNQGEEEEGLFVWMVFFSLKAYSSSRVTVEREGKSVCEDGVIGNTLQSDGVSKTECTTSHIGSEGCEFRQVYSLVCFTITTSHDQFS